MEREESSSTRSGSKVFGSERRQKRSSPPLWEKAAVDVRASERSVKDRTAEERRNRKYVGRPVIFMRSPPHSTRAVGTTSVQRSAAATARAATVLRGTKSSLRVPAEDFPRKAAVRQRPGRGCPNSLRSG